MAYAECFVLALPLRECAARCGVCLKVASHESYASKKRTQGTIDHINGIHSLLGSFMEGFKGVSTKHLSAYLDWFRW